MTTTLKHGREIQLFSKKKSKDIYVTNPNIVYLSCTELASFHLGLEANLIPKSLSHVFLITLRMVNYRLNDFLPWKYWFHQRSENQVLLVNPEDYSVLGETTLHNPPTKKFSCCYPALGMEDCKLFVRQNRLCVTWASRDHQCFNWRAYKVGFGFITGKWHEGWKVENIEYFHNIKHKSDKNWIPLVAGRDLYWLDSCVPLTIHKSHQVCYEKKISEMNLQFDHFHNNALVFWKKGYLVIGHQRKFLPGSFDTREYFHFLLFFNQKWDLVQKSGAFTFFNKNRIEFVNGAVFLPDSHRFVVSVGKKDQEAYLFEISEQVVESLLVLQPEINKRETKLRCPQQIQPQIQIPKIIHQMWLDPNRDLKMTKSIIPEKYHRFSQSFRKWNPDFQHHIWNYSKVHELFSLNETLRPFLKIFETIEPWICKCDFARLGILFVDGGVYADLDCESLQSLQPLLEKREILFIRDLNLKSPAIINGFMACRPGHPLFLFLIKRIAQRVHFKSVWNFLTIMPTVLWKTGPYGLGQDVSDYYQGQQQIPESFFCDPCLIHPLKTTLWDNTLLTLFKKKPRTRMHDCCVGKEIFVMIHQAEGTNWAAPSRLKKQKST